MKGWRVLLLIAVVATLMHGCFTPRFEGEIPLDDDNQNSRDTLIGNPQGNGDDIGDDDSGSESQSDDDSDLKYVPQ